MTICSIVLLGMYAHDRWFSTKACAEKITPRWWHTAKFHNERYSSYVRLKINTTRLSSHDDCARLSHKYDIIDNIVDVFLTHKSGI